MLALSGNSILMDEASELGPIDPQIFVRGLYSPAGSILEQFDKAKEDSRGVESHTERARFQLTVENAIALSKGLSSDWLASYMFEGDTDAEAKGRKNIYPSERKKDSFSRAQS